MHENGVVHRDMNPTNVFIHQAAEDEYQVKIIDFNVSKLVTASKEGNNNL